jgi:hypothetical protein
LRINFPYWETVNPQIYADYADFDNQMKETESVADIGIHQKEEALKVKVSRIISFFESA